MAAAYDAWMARSAHGAIPDSKDEHLDTDFAWMAAWPAVASNLSLGRLDAIARHLRFTLTPHERPMSHELQVAVEAAIANGGRETISAAVDAARAEHVL